MNSKLRNNIILSIIGVLTLGLSPITPEPHIVGKIRWIMGGGKGMQLQDYGDLLMHGLPWVLLIYFLGKLASSYFSGSLQEEKLKMQTLVNDKATNIIDVREVSEFKSGHVKNAINIPLSQLGNNVDKIRKMNGDKILYCRSGNRSGQALSFLKKQGIEKLHNGGGLGDVQKLVK